MAIPLEKKKINCVRIWFPQMKRFRGFYGILKNNTVEAAQAERLKRPDSRKERRKGREEMKVL